MQGQNSERFKGSYPSAFLYFATPSFPGVRRLFLLVFHELFGYVFEVVILGFPGRPAVTCSLQSFLVGSLGISPGFRLLAISEERSFGLF